MNFGSINRRIRRCENEAAAQIVLEHAIAEAVAAEREACAKVCETAEVPIDIDVWMGTKKALTAATAIGLATEIRKRSNAGGEATGAALCDRSPRP
ncbi:MAG: hypothetical protein CVU31_11635 [Betaproteobacteria bacterium HGW-Betaproteobacteria-4]|jgi:hypothetical protein|nr:MAG: hypothetical protein CVU31_11635 [Betaproteobacteria bacterium HGW-Betaproteobacteria-4]